MPFTHAHQVTYYYMYYNYKVILRWAYILDNHGATSFVRGRLYGPHWSTLAGRYGTRLLPLLGVLPVDAHCATRCRPRPSCAGWPGGSCARCTAQSSSCAREGSERRLQSAYRLLHETRAFVVETHSVRFAETQFVGHEDAQVHFAVEKGTPVQLLNRLYAFQKPCQIFRGVHLGTE